MQTCHVEPHKQYPPAVIALGNFDGVHIGHQALIRRGLEKARSLNVDLAVLFFVPHPLTVLHPENKVQYLTDLAEKQRLLADLGVKKALILPFTKEFAAKSAQDFAEHFLPSLGTRHVVVGYNYTFGRLAQGRAEDLAVFGRQYGFTVDVVPEQKIDGRRVSSTDIRQALHEGEVEKAARMLGRPYRLQGRVVAGFRRGRELGFPTANLAVAEEMVLPSLGGYVGRVPIGSRTYGGMMNIGYNPTFEEKRRMRIEVHILDFDGDLYGQPLAVDIVGRLRPERKFASRDDLIKQLKADRASARQYLGL